MNQNGIQVGFSGADVVDLCMVLDFGRLDALNSSYDPNRNYYVANWDSYKEKRQRFYYIFKRLLYCSSSYCSSCQDDCWIGFCGRIYLSIGTNNYLRASPDDQNQTEMMHVHGNNKQNFMKTEIIDRRSIYEEANTALQFHLLDSILK